MRTILLGTHARLCVIALLTLSLQHAAVAAALNARIEVRPLTAGEIIKFKLSGVSPSGGLETVGVGQALYLDALVNAAFAASEIESVNWTLSAKPTGSASALQDSPLGGEVPPSRVADQDTTQVAGRTMLRPDLSGQYSVQLSILTTGGAVTNLTRNITAGLFMGAETCAICHGVQGGATTVFPSWTNTLHSHVFKDSINGQRSPAFGAADLQYNVVGYDTNTAAANGGFDDIAIKAAWKFPENLSPNNWAAMPSALRSVANVQCENCHGPGSEHVYAFGKTNVANWPRLATSFGAGDCAQCHDHGPGGFRTAEWSNSGHSTTTRVPSGPSRAACVRCHTAPGFVQFEQNDFRAGTNTAYEAITCQACHDPHSSAGPHQLRGGSIYTFSDGTEVTNAGSGTVCLQCHHSRNGAAEANIVNYQKGLATWAGGSSFGVHDSPQGDMLEGANAITYGLSIPSGAHRDAVANSCVGCHMQPVPSTDPGFTKVGGHTFRMTHETVLDGVTNVVERTEACVRCHGRVPSFDLVRADYDGDGLAEGVQAEVKRLLDRLTTFLPNSVGVVDGTIKSSLSVKPSWSIKHLRAAYNWQFVKNDGSFGIHNLPFAVGLLRASIGDLTGDANQDGIPDSWQTAYFGSTAEPAASPQASPAGDAIPNWFKWSLGLDPLKPVAILSSGTIWGAAAPYDLEDFSLCIYTAAEIAFETEPGKTYQLQGVSPAEGWSDIGLPVAGTGQSASFLVPTRANVQQFFRVGIGN